MIEAMLAELERSGFATLLPGYIVATGHSEDIVGVGTDLEIIAAADGQSARLPRFKTTAYNGGFLDLPGFDQPVVVDLQGMEIPPPKNVPALFNHSGNDVVGHHEAITNTGKELLIEGVISGVGPKAIEVRDGARNGISWQSSIGAKRTADLQLVAAGQSKFVNGRNLQGPFYLAPKTRLGEVSFVAVGADRTPSAAVIASAQSQGSDMKFSEWLKTKGIDESKLEASAKAVLQAAFDAEIKASAATGAAALGATSGTATATAPAATSQTAAQSAFPAGIQAAGSDGASLMDGTAFVANMRRQAAEEERRINRIRALSNEFGVTEVPINASGAFDITATNRVGFTDYAIQAGWSAQDAELVALRMQRPRTAQAQQQQAQAISGDVILAAMCLTAGIPADIGSTPILASGLPAADRQRVLDQANSGPLQGFGVNHLMSYICAQAGQPWTGTFSSSEFVAHYRNCERMLRASGVSTVSLPGILSNIAQKALAAAWNQVNVAWPKITRPERLNNFKAHTIYRMTADGAFRDVGPDGKLEHGQIAESSSSLRAATKGRKFKFTRQMRIDDDLGALNTWGQWLGREGQVSVERSTFKLMLANTGSHWSLNNNNLITNVLDSDGLSAAKQKFAYFVDQFGQAISVLPDRLVVATPLKVDAEAIINARSQVASGDKVTDRTHWGTLPGGVIDSPYLSNTAQRDEYGNAYSGQSDTLWFLMADPAVLAALLVGFLNGKQQPTVESSTGEFSNDGLDIEAFMDYAVGFGETYGSVKSTGAGS